MQRLTPADRARIPDLYRDGASIRQLARMFGVSYGTIHAIVRAAGVPMRKPGSPRLKADVNAR